MVVAVIVGPAFDAAKPAWPRYTPDVEQHRSRVPVGDVGAPAGVGEAHVVHHGEVEAPGAATVVDRSREPAGLSRTARIGDIDEYGLVRAGTDGERTRARREHESV